MAFMQAALKDSAAASARFQAGLDLLKKQPQTDPDKIAAIGYCFGGEVVLDAARQGVPLAGVVSFHGALATNTPATPGSVKAKFLVEHGALDSMVTADNVAAFKAEMDKAGADYKFVSLEGAKHGFSNPEADRLSHGDHGGPDIGYNPNPCPPEARVRLSSRRRNGVKIFSQAISGTPGPSSSTSTRQRCCPT